MTSFPDAPRPPLRSRRLCWWVPLGIIAVLAVVAVAVLLIGPARGVVTNEMDAAGVERTVHWRDYPGVAGIDPQEVLAGAAAEDGMESARKLEGALRERVDDAFDLEWVLGPTNGDEPSIEPDRPNEFGGSSMLSMYYGGSWQSTSVPHSWEDKQRLLKEFGAVLAEHGFTGPEFEHDDPRLTDAERMKAYGGLRPADQVWTAGMFSGPAGQWVSFGFQDLSKDATGSFTREWEEYSGPNRPREGFDFSYGAPALLPAADRVEFLERLAPFTGIPQPEAQES